jgi:cysteine-rich repeat protein
MRAFIVAALLVGVCLSAPAAHASDITGTVSFQGMVTFAAPIPGIALTDLTVTPRDEAEATGNGEQCTVNTVTSDSPDGTGAYPSGGTVSVNITLSHGGMPVPDGQCILTIHATGTDGATTSARGSATVFLTATDIGTSATLTGVNITVRESKAVAGLDSDCLRWVKKQMRNRARCNFLLLKLGPSAVCKDFSLEEPVGCDPGNYAEAILALGHGGNDQQTDPPSAEAVDFDLLHDQVVCQKRLGKAAINFAAKRSKLVDRNCVDAGADSEMCRNARSNDAKPTLDTIDRCSGDQMVDPMTGRAVPQVGTPCGPCIDGLGNIDRKCLKSCFQTALDELSDGLVGDIAVCGNGILQPGESCDDGNTSGADCCSATCTVTANTPGTEGPVGDATCSDGIDNDCDDATDGADTGCQP